MSDVRYSDLRNVGKTVHGQIDHKVMWSLGATGLQYSAEGLGGIEFDARILPFKVNGERGSRARVMRVKVLLNGSDLYDVTVGYLNKRFDWVEHAVVRDVYADNLHLVLLALDWDGPEALNPRLWR